MDELKHNNGTIIDIDIRDEMKQSFMDYAMSVIVSRALPDVRDGLKPVHRRIFYGMHELNMTPDKPFKKSARLVGEVLGKFHPHGDSSIYDAMVRMAQDFAIRYPMVDGQGNFGSIDDDPPAAMRYTEARMSKIATEMLVDLDAKTVDWSPNFDGTLEEPKVLPAVIPNLLVNGVTGIAVGMATSIPPHNLEEVCSALIYLIDNPEASIPDLMMYIKAPDFPTGGIILGEEGSKQAYLTGRGGVTVRSVVGLEENKKGRTAIIVSEIPYQVSKRRILEQIAELVKDGKLEGISDLRDESDKDGMRIVIETKRDAVPQVVINNLYKHTMLQSNFSIILLAIVDGKPEVLNLKQILDAYINHRINIITRRTQFYLDKASARDHIVQGLLVVQDNIDDVIKLIRNSQSITEAHDTLVQRYELSTAQATAVLDMQLRRITALEKKKLDDEHMDLLAKINDFNDILAKPERINTIIKEELTRISEKYKNGRRTQLLPDPGEITNEDLIPNEKMAIFITNQGYIKRVALDQFEQQARGGRGKGGLTTRENDFLKHFFVSSNHDVVLFFTNKGTVHSLKVYQLPESSRQAKGSSIANLLNISNDAAITAVIPVSKFEDSHHLVMLTKKGVIKKSGLSMFSNIRSNGIIAIGLDEGDELGWVGLSDGSSHFIVGTCKGYSIRFHEEDVRSMGRSARGVKSISLREGDTIVSFDIVPGHLVPHDASEDEDEQELVSAADFINAEEEEIQVENTPQLLTVTDDGMGKRTPLTMYRLQSRGGMGIINIKLRPGSKVSSILVVTGDEHMVMVTQKGMVIRQKVSEIRTIGRSSKGVKLQRLDDEDKVISVQIVLDLDSVEEENTSEEN